MPRPKLQPLTSPWPPTFTSPLRAWEPDVDRAGPLFVLARCGMIYMEPHQLGWKPLKDSYMDTLPSSLTEEHKELVRSSGPFPSCPSLSPYSSSQRSSRIIFTFIITEGKKEQEIPWLSLIILLPGYLPFFWLSLHVVGMGWCSQFLLSLPPSPLLLASPVENSGAWETFYLMTGMSPLSPLPTRRNASGSCSKDGPG